MHERESEKGSFHRLAPTHAIKSLSLRWRGYAFVCGFGLQFRQQHTKLEVVKTWLSTSWLRWTYDLLWELKRDTEDVNKSLAATTLSGNKRGSLSVVVSNWVLANDLHSITTIASALTQLLSQRTQVLQTSVLRTFSLLNCMLHL